jgi:nucleoside 2-deoxyribosyltransferase
MLKKIYYAHAVWLYNTQAEQDELKSIKSGFSQHEIVNPSKLERPEVSSGEDKMEFFKQQVNRCDALVFSRLAGEITAGVGAEVNHALSKKKPVFELRNGRFIRIRRPVSYLSIEETRNLFSKLPPLGFVRED